MPNNYDVHAILEIKFIHTNNEQVTSSTDLSSIGCCVGISPFEHRSIQES